MGEVVTITPERSNHIERLAYNPDMRHLIVTFRNRTIYTYGGVPPQVFAEMTRQQSMGEYLHRVIRRHYPMIDKKKATEEKQNGSTQTEAGSGEE